MRFLISLFLALAAIFCVDRDAAPAEIEMTPPAKTAWTEQTEVEPEEPLIPEYYEYDTAEFYRDCSEMMAVLSMWPDESAVNDTYDKLYAEYCRIDSLSQAAYLRYSLDVTDEAASVDSVEAELVRAACANELCVACHAVMNGPNAESFAAHVGAEAAEYFRGYSELGSQEWELLERETELVNEYYTALESLDEMSYEYAGQSWTAEMLDSPAGDRLYERDYDGYCEVYNGILDQQNGTLGSIYIELVALRQELAALAGYDSYADYAYECSFGRDYTPEDAALFCGQVRQSVAGAYFDSVYYDPRSWGADMEPSPDAETLIALLGEYADDIAPAVQSAWEYLTENELYFIGGESCRMDSSYTNIFAASGAPIIVQKLYGDSGDLATAAHEFGHFCAALQSPLPNYLCAAENYDLLEIHSNGLEVLYTHFYGDVFSDDADAAVYAVLADQLGGVVDGCLFDEFQRRVYAEPELTLDKVNRLYAQVCREFGDEAVCDVDYGWMYVPHNFEQPFYYISYAVSSLAALQIWEQSVGDFDAAVDTWLRVVEAGACGDGYRAVLENAGLTSFTADGAAADICDAVLAYMEAMEQGN